MKPAFAIAGREIGPGASPYIVAEVSGNHGGRIEKALEILDMIKASGADAAKLQTYTADTLTIDHDGPDFTIKSGIWAGRCLYELYQEAHTPWEWHGELFARAKALGITIFSSPFDETSVAFLEKLDVPVYKIASFELVDLPLIQCVAATGRPAIMSTGMASPDEIDEAVQTFKDAGGKDFLLLHCVSGYPTPPGQANLSRIPALSRRYNAAVGLSDHTLGHEVAVASVALGACLIEKHVTLRRSDGGPDAAFSLEPGELRSLVEGARTAYAALGSGAESRSEVEEGSRIFRRSLYVVRDIAAGEPFTSANVRIIRPGFGLPPRMLPEVLGSAAARPLSRGTALALDMIARDRTPQ